MARNPEILNVIVICIQFTFENETVTTDSCKSENRGLGPLVSNQKEFLPIFFPKNITRKFTG